MTASGSEETAIVHALTWLAIGCLAGVWLSALLLFPGLGGGIAAAGYGRWAALHIDVQMYGWCALPLLLLLVHAYAPESGPGPLAGWAYRVWSAALAFVGISILTGHSSGKVFAEWTGAARWVFGLALTLASAAVLDAYRRRLRAERGPRLGGRPGRWARALGIAVLLPAPFAMVLAAGGDAYPPVNPATGGAIPVNTLASVLAVGAVLALSPFLAGLRPRDGGKLSRWIFGLLAAHVAVAVLLGQGPHSHREPLQIAVLASSLIWLPLLWAHLARFPWPATSRPWVAAMAAWAAVLAATGLVAGLPGGAERVKFTNFLVGHVHAAAAGMVTAWLFVMLDVLARRRAVRPQILQLFGDRAAFASWQAGTALHIAALLVLGWAEGARPGLLWGGSPLVVVCYSLRLAGGLVMTYAAWRWLATAFAADPAAQPKEIRHATLDPHLLPARRPV